MDFTFHFTMYADVGVGRGSGGVECVVVPLPVLRRLDQGQRSSARSASHHRHDRDRVFVFRGRSPSASTSPACVRPSPSRHRGRTGHSSRRRRTPAYSTTHTVAHCEDTTGKLRQRTATPQERISDASDQSTMRGIDSSPKTPLTSLCCGFVI